MPTFVRNWPRGRVAYAADFEAGRRLGHRWPLHSIRSRMDESLSYWLGLREASDVSARSAELTLAIAAAMPSDEPLYALDLATGTGSNIRYLAERLPERQHWLAVDQHAALLTDLLDEMRRWGIAQGHDVRI